MKKLILFLGLSLSLFQTQAQDIHWSQFTDNPILLNPANSGNHNATHRFIVAYKDQWRTVSKPFQTFSFSYDTKLVNPDFNLGVSFMNDQVGDGKFKTNELMILPSYEIPLTKTKEHILVSGLQLGINQRNFDFTKFYFDEQYNGVSYDANLPVTENIASDKKTNLNLGAGLVYKFLQKDGSVLNIGLGAYNLNQPNQGFYGEKNKRDVRINAYASYEMRIDEHLTILPAIMFQKQGAFKEILFGTLVRFALSPSSRNYKAVQIGLFLRRQDALILKVGINHKSWFGGLSYDINTSSLNVVSNKRGGMELNIRYLLYQFKPKKIQYRVCPDYI